jgi:hypothetical protein
MPNHEEKVDAIIEALEDAKWALICKGVRKMHLMTEEDIEIAKNGSQPVTLAFPCGGKVTVNFTDPTNNNFWRPNRISNRGSIKAKRINDDTTLKKYNVCNKCLNLIKNNPKRYGIKIIEDTTIKFRYI